MKLFIGVTCTLGLETKVNEDKTVQITFWDTEDPKDKFQTVAENEAAVSQTIYDYIDKRRATNGDYPGRKKSIGIVLE